MVEHDPLTRALAGLTTMSARLAINEILQDFSRHGVAALNANSAGVAVVTDGRLRLVGALDDTAADLELVQEHDQAGPWFDTLVTGEPVAVPDVREAVRRWPRYARCALEHGVLAVAAIPLHIDGETVGALDLYCASTREWSAGDLARAKELAGVTTSRLIGTASRDLCGHALQLQAAFNGWIAIQQAKGMIAEKERVSISEATTRLRQHAIDHNLNLPDVAAAIVNLRLRL